MGLYMLLGLLYLFLVMRVIARGPADRHAQHADGGAAEVHA